MQAITIDTIRAAVETLSESDRDALVLAEFAPLVIFDSTRPLARLANDDGTLNDLGRLVSAWCVLTGEGFTPHAIETARARLTGLGIDVEAIEQ